MSVRGLRDPYTVTVRVHRSGPIPRLLRTTHATRHVACHVHACTLYGCVLHACLRVYSLRCTRGIQSVHYSLHMYRLHWTRGRCIHVCTRSLKISSSSKKLQFGFYLDFNSEISTHVNHGFKSQETKFSTGILSQMAMHCTLKNNI